jgi:hypothetical protein
VDILKNDLSVITPLLSSKNKEDFRHEERISESFCSMKKGTIGYALLGKELLYHLKVCESFKRELLRGITACQ